MNGIYYETGANRRGFDYTGNYELVVEDGVTIGARDRNAAADAPLAYVAAGRDPFGRKVQAMGLGGLGGEWWRHWAVWAAAGVAVGVVLRKVLK